MDISRSAVMVAVDRMCREDPDFLREARLKGGAILSDVREMEDDEIVGRLLAMGLDFGRETLAPLVVGMRSAADLEDELVERAGLALSEADDDFALVAVTVLWERWFPEIANAEMLEESMQRGYRLNENPYGLAAAVEEWARTWEMVKELAERFQARSVENFDRMFPGIQYVFNWSSDFEMELGNAETFGIPSIGRESYMKEFDRVFPVSAGHLLPIGGPFDDPFDAPVPSKRKKVGRNDPCPCGSGRKFKKCCGR